MRYCVPICCEGKRPERIQRRIVSGLQSIRRAASGTVNICCSILLHRWRAFGPWSLEEVHRSACYTGYVNTVDAISPAGSGGAFFCPGGLILLALSTQSITETSTSHFGD